MALEEKLNVSLNADDPDPAARIEAIIAKYMSARHQFKQGGPDRAKPLEVIRRHEIAERKQRHVQGVLDVLGWALAFSFFFVMGMATQGMLDLLKVLRHAAGH